MNYISTRGGIAPISFVDAVMMGLAADGGLLLPEEIPVFSAGELEELGQDRLMAMFEPGARFFWGSGGLLSTPDDFLRFAQMLLNGGVLGDTRILRSETVALMTGNTLPAAHRRGAATVFFDA